MTEKRKPGRPCVLGETKQCSMYLPVKYLEALKRIYGNDITEGERVRIAVEDHVKSHEVMDEAFNE